MSDPAAAEVVDLMPHLEAMGVVRAALIRRVRVTRGRMRFALRCRPRFDYGLVVPTVRPAERGVIFEGAGVSGLRLTGSVGLEISDGQARAYFALEAGDEAFFVLGDVEAEGQDSESVERCIAGTIAAWRRWARKSTYRGRLRSEVMRSALALKLLTSATHGSIAAAATFELPEATGAGRNWDYRATWLRDASFTVYAFMRLGFREDTDPFRTSRSMRVRSSSRFSRVISDA